MSDSHFEAQLWQSLTVPERVARCHIMNNEALILAKSETPKVREAYCVLARAWMQLADAIVRGEAHP